MPLSDNIGSYEDVQRILDAALTKGGAQYRLDSTRAAMRWRLRAYYYRKLLVRAEQKRLNMPGFPVSTPYDRMHLTVADSTVIIDFSAVMGELTTKDGKPLALAPRNTPDYNPPVNEEDRKLEEAARRLLESGEAPDGDAL